MDVEVGNSNLGLFDFCSDFCWSEKGDTIDTSKDEIKGGKTKRVNMWSA
ncbi:MAG: hypothetical protein ACLSCE_09995 [Bacteroides cellulosilyticus]